MSTTAVTPAAPAAARSHTPERHADFLPSDKNYRLTGEMPSTEKEEEESSSTERTEAEERKNSSPVKEETSAASTSETAAASEAATPQKEEKPAPAKTAAASESRWAKVTRENKELRERLTRLESGQQQRETQQGPQPAVETKTEVKTDAKAANPKPKIDDVDPKTGKPKFATYQDYEDARDDYNRKEAIREFQETSSKSAREQQLTETEKTIQKVVTERATEARKNYADYDDVIAGALSRKNEHGQDALFYVKGSPIDGFFLDSERGHDVMYAIAKNFEAHKHIFARDAAGKYLMNPVRQVRELAKIEHSLPAREEKTAKAGEKTEKTSSATTITQAPRPPHQTSGKGAVGKDPIAQAVEEGDSDTYMREQNARDLARRRKGK
jgi:hypothetical protein